MSSPHLSITLTAFGVAALLHLAALTLFPKWHLLDRPEKYNLQRGRLPYPTGILSVLTFLILFVHTRGDLSFQDQGLILSLLLLFVMNVIDDLRGLPAWAKLLMQVLIGFILFATGTRIYTITNPIGGILKLDTVDVMTSFFGPLPVLSGIFTIVWVILTMNAFNWFDGIPGQVSVLSVIGSLTIGFLALSNRVDQPQIAMIAFLLAGIAIASAIFDFPPNKVVMGDTGAMFFGLMLGTLTIYAGGKVATAFLVLGVPLIDSILVGLRRLHARKSPLKGDLDHLHHRLLRKGWNERKVIILTAALGSAFGITALFLSTFGKFIAALLLVFLILGLTVYAAGQKR